MEILAQAKACGWQVNMVEDSAVKEADICFQSFNSTNLELQSYEC